MDLWIISHQAFHGANLSDNDHQNAAIVFRIRVLGMTESQYQNDFSSGHRGWLPVELFEVIRKPVVTPVYPEKPARPFR